MFKLIFGIVWSLIVVPISLVVFKDLFEFPLFISLFIFSGIGLFFIYSGLMSLYKDCRTEKNGMERYGFIAGIRSSGSYVNGRPLLLADILVCIDDYTVCHFIETIGFPPVKYCTGEYVTVLYCKDDVSLIKKVHDYKILGTAQKTLRDEYVKFFPTYFDADPSKTIIVNGVEYVKKY